MASTLNLYNAIAFVSPYIKAQRLNVNNMEPGLGMGNIILQRMLGRPCVWRFNRATLTINLSAAGGTDYAVALSNLGSIETQWITDANGKDWQLNGALSLAKVSASGRPTKMAPQYDDNAGNITFRFNRVPNANLTAYIDYQMKAQLLTSYASNFAPVPDEFAYIFYTLYLAWAGQLVNDARFPMWMKEGISMLLGAQGGLDEQSRAIFVGEWMDWFATVERKKQMSQQEAIATTNA